MIAVALCLRLVLAADEPFGVDKALHFSASFGIAGLVYAGAALVGQPEEARLTAAIGLSLFAGVAKELLDSQGFGSASALDLAWDVAGAVLGTLIVWIIDRVFFASALAPLTPTLSPPGEREIRDQSLKSGTVITRSASSTFRPEWSVAR